MGDSLGDIVDVDEGDSMLEQSGNRCGKLRNMTAIYLSYHGKILLLYRQGSCVADGLWIGSAGGHFEECELNDAHACVLRELFEELAVTEDMLENLSLRYIALRQTNGEIRQNYYFFADLKEMMQLYSNEGTLQWFSVEELAELEMPFTAKFVLEHYVTTGKYTEDLYGGVSDGNQVVFTRMA